MPRKAKGWVTPYGFGDFKEPVTYEEACEAMKAVSEAIAMKFTNNKETPDA